MSNPLRLDLPLAQLLERFGTASPVPGAGSAAAVAAALAARLTLAAARGEQATHRPELERLAAELASLTDRDSEAFARYWKVRKSAEEASSALQAATAVPLAIARGAVRVAALAAELATTGLRAARAECVTAASLALAAAEGSVFVMGENLSRAGEAEWAAQARAELGALRQEARDLRNKLSALL